MQFFRSAFTAMGGANELVVVCENAELAQKAMEAAAREVLRIQDKYSRYRQDDGSIVHRINGSAGTGRWISCDMETTKLFQVAKQLYEKSDGLFDITSGILRKAWNFKSQTVPPAELVNQILPLIDFAKVEFKDNHVRLPQAGMEIDFGGFGKEYAADAAGAVLRNIGITSGYVNLGGDIHALGPQPDGAAWLIGVQNPRKTGKIAATIPISQGGLATSGDYEQFFIKNDRRYCHIINPKTGFPVSCWSSVSVSHSSTLMAGSYSTITMLKEEKGQEFLNAS